MACSCRRVKGLEIANDDDSDNADTYGNACEDERNIFYGPNSDDEQENIGDDDFSKDENICRDMIFVDGNDDDLRVCEYEDTLMERVWWSSKPPKIPRDICVVPARRIQITKERLSPTLTSLSSMGKAPSNEANTRHMIKSDVKYDPVIEIQGEKKFSCQKKTITIVPSCARELEKFL